MAAPSRISCAMSQISNYRKHASWMCSQLCDAIMLIKTKVSEGCFHRFMPVCYMCNTSHTITSLGKHSKSVLFPWQGATCWGTASWQNFLCAATNKSTRSLHPCLFQTWSFHHHFHSCKSDLWRSNYNHILSQLNILIFTRMEYTCMDKWCQSRVFRIPSDSHRRTG